MRKSMLPHIMSAAVVIVLLGALQANCIGVSTVWDPQSFRGCTVSRGDLIETMFGIFDRNNTGLVSDRMVYCVFNAPGVFTDTERSLVDGGAGAIVDNCDANGDGFMEESEVRSTHTCISDCDTAITLGMAMDIININMDTCESTCF